MKFKDIDKDWCNKIRRDNWPPTLFIYTHDGRIYYNEIGITIGVTKEDKNAKDWNYFKPQMDVISQQLSCVTELLYQLKSQVNDIKRKG
jgi:hypothetical protein